MIDDLPLLCVFPYIELSRPVVIRGELLSPFTLLDQSELPDSEKNVIRDIQKYFYWHSNQNIANVTWTILRAPADHKHIHDFKQHLEEIHRVLGYICCVPDERPQIGGLSHHYEQADYYVFSPNPHLWRGFLNCIAFDVSSTTDSEQEYVKGYDYIINQIEYGHISDGCRLYPSSLSIRRTFNLGLILENIHLKQSQVYIYDLFDSERVTTRHEANIFNIVEWYNRSCSVRITPDLALIYLAIAFEAILLPKRPERPITAKSKSNQAPQKGQRVQAALGSRKRVSKQTTLLQATRLLVGEIPRLDMWLHQFYNARSRIVHEGEWSQLRFLPDENETKSTQANEYGELTAYGWLIFRACMNAKLAGLVKTVELDLKSKFFNHAERLNRMKAALSDIPDPFDALDSIRDDVRTLYRYPWPDTADVDLAIVWDVGKLIVQKLLDLKLDLRPEQVADLRNLVADIEPSEFELRSDIIQYTTLVFERTAELPEDKVRTPALEDLRSPTPPWLSKIRDDVTRILEDGRNENLSVQLRQQLQNIVQLIELSVYRTKLTAFTLVYATVREDLIVKNYSYSVFMEGYAEFLRAVLSFNGLASRLAVLNYYMQQRA